MYIDIRLRISHSGLREQPGPPLVASGACATFGMSASCRSDEGVSPMRRDLLAVLVAAAALAGAAAPAAAEGGCSSYKPVTASSSQATTQQTASVQTQSKTTAQ
jgi:hypothetical protein